MGGPSHRKTLISRSWIWDCTGGNLWFLLFGRHSRYSRDTVEVVEEPFVLALAELQFRLHNTPEELLWFLSYLII